MTTLNVDIALTYFDDVRFRSDQRPPAVLRELREQSIVGVRPPAHNKDAVPWLGQSARRHFLTRIAVHERQVLSSAHRDEGELDWIGHHRRAINEMHPRRPPLRGINIQITPPEFIRGAEILFSTHKVSRHWPRQNILGAVAAWWGISYKQMASIFEDVSFSDTVSELNSDVAAILAKAEKGEAPLRQMGITMSLELFEDLVREVRSELGQEVDSMRELFVRVGEKMGCDHPFPFVYTRWKTPEFREALAPDIIEYIEATRAAAKEMTLEEFVGRAKQALDEGHCDTKGILTFIGRGRYPDPWLGALRRYQNVYADLIIREPGLVAILGNPDHHETWIDNPERAARLAELDRVLSKPLPVVSGKGDIEYVGSEIDIHVSGNRRMRKGISPQEFVGFMRQIMDEGTIGPGDTSALFTAVGELNGFRKPYISTCRRYRAPGFRDKIIAIDRAVVDFIEGDKHDDPQPDGTGGVRRMAVRSAIMRSVKLRLLR